MICCFTLYDEPGISSWSCFHICAPCKLIQIPESGNPFDRGTGKLGKFSRRNPKSWALESGIQLKESVIPLTIGIRRLSSTDKDRNPVPKIRNPRRGIQNPRLCWITLHGAMVCYFTNDFFTYFAIFS